MAKRAMMLGLDGADPFVVKKLIDMGRLPNLSRILDKKIRKKRETARFRQLL